ncbi:MAG: acyl carrier protein [Pseudomonadota bacterium]|uniref:acyl carrier protein n=1 Tax=Polaromonas sp. YR568 TaxID=1855301 RepID=UPI00271684E9|nr:acyl carrier protein [Polaromonas sp.]MDO8719958.1 acyl carrier protein [Polaromonas sp.]MDO9258863.1 acyl carrier protein [Polaromonas sp.]
MTNDRPALAATVLGILRSIAPEVEPDALDPTRPLRHQVDLDSMDWLNFLVALHERLGVNIPEADYAQLVTLDNVLDYLLAKLGPASA